MAGKQIVIDGKSHLVGRLAATIAKQALAGAEITVVRCEELHISGPLYRNRRKFMEFMNLRSNSNPRKHSHIHYRSPALMFKRVCRGMLPHKTARGTSALARIHTFEGCPTKLEKAKKVCVPDALKNIRIMNTMPTTRLGDLATSVGWRYASNVEHLETKRKAAGETYWVKKQETQAEFRAKREAVVNNAPQDIKDALALLE
ncbi:60S ribosomal protein L13a [Gregarina niphandrodes]|uniref:60S ribosomal protein L13a n=1 Tax=Gregarina niphandrodes TaxID=110365 RepID=A0A023B011_GRENI|nr:60S ribosomal protein L13a [Gregarina niphandrodes]EZG44862.1 60S ribosomal protein L13a [Gregarina niphandrodes]|eukprot:XP_011132630.1 60S ribosomal protein L13a [Gregarina niphandrodes]